MKAQFSTSWKGSTQRRKQRKYAMNAPAHIRRKFMAAPLSKELKKKHGKRNLPVRTGDSVKIVRGQFKGKTGKIERVSLAKTKVYITGIEAVKKDGSKTLYPIHPSNIMIQTLELADKRRIKTTKKQEKQEKKEA